MDLSIIIPSFNTSRLLDRCMRSIDLTTKNADLSYEIIVVDNASKDNTRQILNNKYPRVVKIYNSHNLGYGRANNLGIAKAKGAYILLLNSDIVVQDRAIQELYTFALQLKRAFVGGKLYNENRTPQSSSGPDISLINIFFMLFLKGDQLGLTRSSPTKVKQVDWISGACLMGQKTDFLAVGGFDEHIFLYMEEIEFLYRARKLGYNVFFYPKAEFIHQGAASSGSRKNPVIQIYKGLKYVYRKHHSKTEQKILDVLLYLKAFIAIIISKLLRNSELKTTYEQALEVVS